MFVASVARFAQANAIAETAVDPYEAFHFAYEVAADIRDLSPDVAWKSPLNAFRGAFLAWCAATDDEQPQRRRELAAAGRTVLAMPWPPRRETDREAGMEPVSDFPSGSGRAP